MNQITCPAATTVMPWTSSEKSFEEITIQDLLDRAGVGRSTFYVHYRDKDDLFLSDVAGTSYAALLNLGKLNDVQALGRGFFARSMAERLRMAAIEMEPVERSARAHALAGSLF